AKAEVLPGERLRMRGDGLLEVFLELEGALVPDRDRACLHLEHPPPRGVSKARRHRASSRVVGATTGGAPSCASASQHDLESLGPDHPDAGGLLRGFPESVSYLIPDLYPETARIRILCPWPHLTGTRPESWTRSCAPSSRAASERWGSRGPGRWGRLPPLFDGPARCGSSTIPSGVTSPSRIRDGWWKARIRF